MKRTSGTDFCKNISVIKSKNIPAQAHLYNLTRLEIHTQAAKFLTHCLIWSSLEAGKLQRRKTGKKAKEIFNLPFSRKKKNAEAFLPGTARGQGSCCACMHIHTRSAAPFSASKTSINAQSKIYSSEKKQPKAFQGRQLGCRACGLTKKCCRLQLELTS